MTKTWIKSLFTFALVLCAGLAWCGTKTYKWDSADSRFEDTDGNAFVFAANFKGNFSFVIEFTMPNISAATGDVIVFNATKTSDSSSVGSVGLRGWSGHVMGYVMGSDDSVNSGGHYSNARLYNSGNGQNKLTMSVTDFKGGAGRFAVDFVFANGDVKDQAESYSNRSFCTDEFQFTSISLLQDVTLVSATLEVDQDETAAYSRSIKSSTCNWESDGAWTSVADSTQTVAIPENGTDVTMTFTTDSQVTMNSASTLRTLEIDGAGKATFIGSASLVSSNTVIGTDVDVTGITSDLRAVTISEGKTLTAGANTKLAVSSNAGEVKFPGPIPSPLDFGRGGGKVTLAGDGSNETYLGGSHGEIEVAAGASITVPHLRFLNTVYTSDRVTLDVNGTLTVNSVSTNPNVWNDRLDYKGILFGHYHGQGVYNVNTGGKFLGEAAYMQLVYTAEAQALNVTGGLLKIRGLYAHNGNATVNLTDNGTIQIAEFPTGGAAFTQNFGHGTVQTYSYGGSTGWTNAHPVNFTDSSNGTTFDPAGMSNTFTGAITDGVEGGGAKVIVDASGVVDFSGASSLSDTISYTVKSGTLILPAGKEGAATVANGATLKLVLDDEKFFGSYTAENVTGEGTVAFVKAGALDDILDSSEGAIGSSYTYPVPTWTPVDANSKWSEETLWSSGSCPTQGDVVIDATSIIEDVAVQISSKYGNIVVKGHATYETALSFSGGAPISVNVIGKVKLPIDTINNEGTTLTVSDGAVLIADVASEATLTKALSGNYAFWKDGEGTLTLGANVVVNNGCAVQKGVLKFGFDSNNKYTIGGSSYSSAGNVAVATGAVLDFNGVIDAFMKVVTLSEGSVLRNSRSDITSSNRQLQGIVLSGNATADAQEDFGLIANSHDDTALTLNGYTLTKTGAGTFWLDNTTGSSGSFRIKEGALSVVTKGCNLAGVNLSIEGNSTLALNANLTGLASLRMQAGADGGVKLKGRSFLQNIKPTLDASLVDPSKVNAGAPITLLTDEDGELTEDAFAAISVGSRFTTTNITDTVVTATVGANGAKFLHYDFNDGVDSKENAVADDSSYFVNGWGEVSSGNTPVATRNGKAARLYYTSDSACFSPYWGANTSGVSPFYAGAVTITSVIKPQETNNSIVWGLGTKGSDWVALVVKDSSTISLVSGKGASKGVEVVALTGIKNMTSSYHFVGVVCSPEGTELVVDGIKASSEKVVPYFIGTEGQLGSVHGGLPTGYARQGATGCYLDDWAVYDARLTEAELEALRTTFCPRPFHIRIR